jgi:hypothetical protein
MCGGVRGWLGVGHGGGWRRRAVESGSRCMCIDYTSLNRAGPKDEYPLPHICQIVNSTTACELLSFLDAYSG